MSSNSNKNCMNMSKQDQDVDIDIDVDVDGIDPVSDEAPTTRGPVKLPAMYTDEARTSLSESSHFADHLVNHWGF